MIARKNKKKKKLDGFMVPVPFAAAVVIVSIVALGHVWLGCMCDCLRKEIKTLEVKKDAMEKRLHTEEYKWMRMKSPANIENALAKFGIKMTWPRGDQVVRRPATDTVSNQFDGSKDLALRYASIGRTVAHE
jgi:hypothetical protein